MADRKPDARESTPPGPFMRIDRPRGTVEIWALGGDRFRVTTPRYEQIVVGYDAAQEAADELARRLE